MDMKGVGVKLVQKMERFTFRIPAQLLQKIKERAEEMGVSTNAMILQILWAWAKEQKEES